jgi:hypothetical protein
MDLTPRHHWQLDIFAYAPELMYRFGGSLQGRWTGTTVSPVKALDGLELTVDVTSSSNPDRTGWSGQLPGEPTAWARQQGDLIPQLGIPK